MKDFKFDHYSKAWDRYGAFHNSHWGIVEFETGEVIVRSSSVDNRMMYDKYGIQIVASTDTECPPLYIDKECTEPCPKAWLTQGGYTPLAIDYEQKVAFQLQTPTRSGQTRKQGLHIQNHLGSHVRDARGYWAGHGRLPITNGKTKLQKPNPEYKKKVLGILNQVQVAVTAAFRMKEPKNYWNNGVYPAKLEWQDMTVEDIVAEICNDNGAMRDVAMKGFKLPRQLKEVDFLYIKGEQ
ncbi:hypothetical protein OAA02_00345 [bacterium]|nr:hypothetical protein [bacterium]